VTGALALSTPGAGARKWHGEKTSNKYAADQQHCSTGAIKACQLAWTARSKSGGDETSRWHDPRLHPFAGKAQVRNHATRPQ
jgi:hypothetical protein